MHRAMMKIVKTICALSLFGCIGALDRVAVLQPGAERIRLVNQEPPGCAQLGDVIGKSQAEAEPEAALQGARNDLRNRAQAMGATHVIVQNSASDKAFGMWRPAQETVVSGVALKCPVEGPSGAGEGGPQAGAQGAGSTPAPAASAAPPRCTASALPQWKDADPVYKKKLLAYCRAPAGSPDPGMPQPD